MVSLSSKSVVNVHVKRGRPDNRIQVTFSFRPVTRGFSVSLAAVRGGRLIAYEFTLRAP